MPEAVLPSRTYTPAQWGRRGPHVYIEAKAHLDGVDALAATMERKWGVDRLRLLVDPELRRRFDSQRAKLNTAIHAGDLPDLERECPRMCNAWRALDAAATAAGAEPLTPTVWEAATSTGMVITIVRDTTDAHAVSRTDGRLRQVWTLDEVIRCIEAFPAVIKAKQTFPGATVTAARPITDPVDDLGDDEIPF